MLTPFKGTRPFCEKARLTSRCPSIRPKKTGQHLWGRDSCSSSHLERCFRAGAHQGDVGATARIGYQRATLSGGFDASDAMLWGDRPRGVWPCHVSVDLNGLFSLVLPPWSRGVPRGDHRGKGDETYEDACEADKGRARERFISRAEMERARDDNEDGWIRLDAIAAAGNTRRTATAVARLDVRSRSAHRALLIVRISDSLREPRSLLSTPTGSSSDFRFRSLFFL